MAIAERIGIAIAAFDSAEVIERCMHALGQHSFVVVLFDDGSSDDTIKRAQAAKPGVTILRGDGTNWWAGGTEKAVAVALAKGVDHVVLLNPDVELDGDDILAMVDYCDAHPSTIVAPLVVNRLDERKVAWAGSTFGRLGTLPIYTSRYVFRPGMNVEAVGSTPYDVDEVHGRGTVVSRAIIQRIGLFDPHVFPHYGADNDFSWRARAAGYRIKIIPSVHARLEVENTGLPHPFAHLGMRPKLRHLRRYLFDRKSGDAARVWWKLVSRHVPRYARVPSYIFNVGLNLARRL